MPTGAIVFFFILIALGVFGFMRSRRVLSKHQKEIEKEASAPLAVKLELAPDANRRRRPHGQVEVGRATGDHRL